METYIRLINKTEDYIENHLGERITLEDLAKHLNISKFHYHRIFSEYSNETLHTFISRTKMERSAIFMVVRNDLTITEIAYRYGYSETSAYCRAFKKQFDATPQNYRTARNVNHSSK